MRFAHLSTKRPSYWPSKFITKHNNSSSEQSFGWYGFYFFSSLQSIELNFNVCQCGASILFREWWRWWFLYRFRTIVFNNARASFLPKIVYKYGIMDSFELCCYSNVFVRRKCMSLVGQWNSYVKSRFRIRNRYEVGCKRTVNHRQINNHWPRHKKPETL